MSSDDPTGLPSGQTETSEPPTQADNAQTFGEATHHRERHPPSEAALIQIADEHTTDTAIVRLITSGQTPLIPLFTYLIGESDPNDFFLQIVTPNRNLSRFSPHPFDTISLAQMLALIEERGYSTDAIVSNISYYDAEINAIINGEDNTAVTAYIRPTTGTVHRIAQTGEIERYLELPAGDGVDRRIGVLARSGETEVPINASDRILNHHILVAGSTGSGKSNLLSNISHAATSAGRCAILFDHKPDHQDHHYPNPEPRTQNPKAYSLDGKDTNLSPLRYWTLDESDPNNHAQVISVRAGELDPEILAGTIFYHPNESIQAEIFAHIASTFADDQRVSNNHEWTIHDLLAHIRNNNNGAIRDRLYGDQGGPLAANTMGAIRRKINAPGRIPRFVDPQPPANHLTGIRRPIRQISEIFQPGLNVIRINETDNRGYALFLQNLLSAAERYRAAASQQSNGTNHDVEIIVDEASELFRAPSRYLRDAATEMLAEQIRKGRSLHIGYVVAVQSAGDVPEHIRNNLNSTIIGRHRNFAVLREAIPTARTEMLQQADKLAPGEMFVDLFGVRSLLLAQMDHSRSRLTASQ